MAKFKYRMQNVLDIKQKLEDASKMEFMEATARVNEEEQRLEQLENRLRMYEMEGRKLRNDRINILDIRQNTEGISVIKEQIKNQQENLEEAKKFQARKRAELQNAMKERKTQDKLYENALENFKQEENARESKEVDELVSYVYGQRSKEQGEK